MTYYRSLLFALGAVPALALSLGQVGCSNAGSTTTDPAADTSTGDAKVLAGTFLVSLVGPDAANGTAGYTSVVGKVSDGPTPSQVAYTESASSGSCKLLKPRVPFCNSACTGGAVCVDDDLCQSYPTAKSVGTVHATGIRTSAGATEFSMDPIANNYQPTGGITLPYPAFAEGDAIKLDASGGAYRPFSLSSTGISPLKLLSTSIKLASAQALNLSWTPPGSAGAGAKVAVKLDISHHGGTKGMISCEADDTGSLTIAPSLVTELLNLGTAGFPTIIVTRTAPVGSAVIAPGRVELTISSTVEQAVEVPGVVSCKDTSECPAGQSCQSDLTCK